MVIVVVTQQHDRDRRQRIVAWPMNVTTALAVSRAGSGVGGS
jgi:hypothetical protein